jgi:tetrapyrrole methylase family protein/MazG family protein/ATP diphosphatase
MSDASELRASTPVDTLREVMARLRSRESGCTWDLEQTFSTIAPYTLEEAYEVVDAIERQDMSDLKDELGDLLLQVIFHAQMAEELDAFDFNDVAQSAADKMVRRHPHIFADVPARTSVEQTLAWEEIKARERADRFSPEVSALGGIAVALPALTRAVKLSSRAARVGFAWSTTTEILAKLKEEIAELEHELEHGRTDAAGQELGDVLFVCANIARQIGADPEAALRYANEKFIRRFRYIEERLAASGRTPAQSDLTEMDRMWDEAKAIEKRPGVGGDD